MAARHAGYGILVNDRVNHRDTTNFLAPRGEMFRYNNSVDSRETRVRFARKIASRIRNTR